jgi:NADH:ubiquinone oxidoreductase subunit 5 (subunit L)/multisubunit Na+/H+ antiporter MnhA subunit
MESSCLAATMFGAAVIGILSWLLLSYGEDSQSDQDAAKKAAKEENQNSSSK